MKKTIKNIALTGTVMLALTACSTTNKATDKATDKKTDDMTSMTHDDDIDPEFMVLSDSQYELVRRNNQFAINLFS